MNEDTKLILAKIEALTNVIVEVKVEVAGVKNEVLGVKSEVAGVKGEVVGIKETIATKTDLEQVRSEMATKDQVAIVAGDLDRLAQATAKGFAGVDARFDKTDKKIDNLNSKVDDVEKNLIEQIEDLARMTNGALASKQDKFVYA